MAAIVPLYLPFVMSDLSVESWKKKNDIKHLGVPRYVASGTHVNGSTRYRFLVMDQFGEDVEKKFTEHGRKFNIPTVCSLAIQLVCTSTCLQMVQQMVQSTWSAYSLAAGTGIHPF